MDSGEDEPADDEESADPSLADLAEDLAPDGAEVADPEGELDPVDDGATEASTSFTDLASRIRRMREGAPAGDSTETIEWDWRHADTGRPASRSPAMPDEERVLDLVDDATNVLLVGDLLTPAEHGVCATLLGVERPANLVLVTLTQSSDERLAVCRRYLDELPERTAIVDVGDPVRSDDRSGRTTDASGSIVIESVADPTDLMRIGITISRQLAEFEGGEAPTLLCFHSLTALLQFVEDERSMFRFIHTLRGRVRAAGARAHYHLDAHAHDEKVMALLRPLFDVTLRVENDGGVSTPQLP